MNDQEFKRMDKGFVVTFLVNDLTPAQYAFCHKYNPNIKHRY